MFAFRESTVKVWKVQSLQTDSESAAQYRKAIRKQSINKYHSVNKYLLSTLQTWKVLFPHIVLIGFKQPPKYSVNLWYSEQIVVANYIFKL